MIKGFDLTIYELLGYLVPGTVALTGLCLAAGVFAPDLVELSRWSGGWWLWLSIGAAYVTGHVLQAVANPVFGEEAVDAALAAVLAQLPSFGFDAIAHRLQVAERAVIESWRSAEGRRGFLTICDAVLDQEGNASARDLYVYREGFYRSACLALRVLALGSATWLVRFWQKDEVAHSVLLAVTIVLLVGSSVGFGARYRRFVGYRVGASVWGAVTVATAEKKTTPTVSA